MKEENPLAAMLGGLSSALSEQGLPGAKREWWNSFQFPETPEFSVRNLINCARSALFGQALAGGNTVYESAWSESITTDNNGKIITCVSNYIAQELGGRMVYNLDSNHKDSGELFYVFSGGAIFVTLTNVSFTLRIVGTTTAHMQLGEDIINSCIKGRNESVETE